MRFSWEGDITTMGLWEGFTSIIGFAMVLAVNISFVPHFGGKKIDINRDSFVFFYIGCGYENLVFYGDHSWYCRQ